MDSQNQTPIQRMRPQRLVDLLPGIQSLIKKEKGTVPTTAKKQVPYGRQSKTAQKSMKPMTIAELRAVQSSTSRVLPSVNSTCKKSKPWNSSVKVDKKKHLTAGGQMKNSTARKVLEFQPNIKPAATNRTTIAAAMNSTKFKDITNASRISGVCKMPETPVFKPFIRRVAETNLKINAMKETNISNDSFLLYEKEINEFEDKCYALTEISALEKISEVTPPIATPFTDYRNASDYFNNTSDVENSIRCTDNTIMSFDKEAESKENNKKGDSIISSLCEIIKEAKVTIGSNINNNGVDLIELRRQTKNQIKTLNDIKQILLIFEEEQLRSLQYLDDLIKHDKDLNETKNVNNEQTTTAAPLKIYKSVLKQERVSPENSPIISRPTVITPTIITPKTPSYKIPRKSIGLKKKVIYKSLPNISNELQTPEKINDRGLKLYMEMKQQNMPFLNTPLKKSQCIENLDTPAVASYNLQKQLNKLFNNS